jgi:hypothetical protein
MKLDNSLWSDGQSIAVKNVCVPASITDETRNEVKLHSNHNSTLKMSLVNSPLSMAFKAAIIIVQ